jgi:hypothetical protein
MSVVVSGDLTAPQTENLSRCGMFKYSLPVLAFPVLAFVFLASAPCPALAQGGGGPCDLASARAIAHMYIVANPLLAQKYQRTFPMSDPHPWLVYEVNSNPTLFGEASTAIQCGKALGTRLVQLGIQSFNPNSYNDVMRRFGGTVVNEFAPQVAQSLDKDAVYFVTLGQELIWLTNVLPAAAQGNWVPYNDTGSSDIQRQRIRANLPVFNQMIQTFYAIDPVLAENALNFQLSMNPFIEQQIVVLALINVGS